MPKKIHIAKSNAKKFSIDGGTEGLIYPDHPKGEHTIAKIAMRGNYPDVGYSVNTRCTETIVMLKGKMKIRANEKVYGIKPGDIFVILPETKYRIMGSGEVFDIITPRWDKKQNKVVPDKTFTIKP